jgi:hypothetical protein
MIIVIANFVIMFVFNIDPAYLRCPRVECAEDNRNVMHQRVVLSSSVVIQYQVGLWREAKLDLQDSVTNDNIYRYCDSAEIVLCCCQSLSLSAIQRIAKEIIFTNDTC